MTSPGKEEARQAGIVPVRLVPPRSRFVTEGTGAEVQPILPPRAVEKMIDVGLPETQVTPVLGVDIGTS